ncbi:MAG: phytanoyl-CoA dioxygenase [Rhodospirillales bacterium]|nr:phytanoyl-CoA dioxygenase [Rhodospirillales bacterium]
MSDVIIADRLAHAEIETYHATGWVLVRGFFGSREIQRIARWIDELLALPEEPGKHMVYWEESPAGESIVQRIENFVPYHRGFDRLVRRGKLRDAADRLIGEPSCLFKEKVNFKMPGGAGFEPHQDQQAGWSRYAPIFVTALVTIDPATLENGCLEMGTGPRLTRLVGEEWRPLSPPEMGGVSLMPMPTEPGDVLFFDSYAPHASKPNRTDGPRRILYVTYNAASAGNHRSRYLVEKRASFPPDIERAPGAVYKFRV